jgi:hypothetical protein
VKGPKKASKAKAGKAAAPAAAADGGSSAAVGECHDREAPLEVPAADDAGTADDDVDATDAGAGAAGAAPVLSDDEESDDEGGSKSRKISREQAEATRAWLTTMYDKWSGHWPRNGEHDETIAAKLTELGINAGQVGRQQCRRGRCDF